jgi:hypothetical protein
MKKEAVQYTLRQVPRAVDEALRKRARLEGKSLNQITLEILESGLGVNGKTAVHHDLDFMVGSWVEDPAFVQALKDQDQIDPKLWR